MNTTNITLADGLRIKGLPILANGWRVETVSLFDGTVYISRPGKMGTVAMRWNGDRYKTICVFPF